MKGVIKGSGKKQTYWIDGRQVTKAKWKNEFPPRVETGCEALIGWKPIVSDAMAVHSSQVEKATVDARKKGVPTDFMPDGRPVFRTRQHRAAYLRAYGYYDRDAGYGDPADGGPLRLNDED